MTVSTNTFAPALLLGLGNIARQRLMHVVLMKMIATEKEQNAYTWVWERMNVCVTLDMKQMMVALHVRTFRSACHHHA